jgi:hypothetical protein
VRLWDHLNGIKSRIGRSWVVIGDFNEGIHLSETLGGHFLMARAMKSKEVKKTCSLMDLGSKGQKYTWHIHIYVVMHIAKRLDKAIVNCDWRMQFLEVFVETLCGDNY